MNEEILSLHRELIKIPSVSSDIEKLHEIVDFVESQFDGYTNAIIKRYEWNKKPSIVIQNFEWLEADIILNGHLDVVPASSEDQFEPYEEDGKIYARGAGDMKAWDAIMITLMKDLFTSKFTEKKVSLILTTDEEIWWEDGAKQIVELWYRASEGVLVPDAGSLETIVTAEKGIIDVTIDIKWVSGHSSRPWKWTNAIDQTYKLYGELKELLEEPNKLVEEKEYWSSTVQLTTISGWVATNVVPESCTAHFNIRVTEKFQDMNYLKTQIETLCEKYGKITEYHSGSLAYTDPNHQFIQDYLSVCENILWFKPTQIKEHWATDWRYFAENWMPLLLHLPTCKNIHTYNEYVVKEDIFKIYDCYRHFIFWE